MHGLTLNITVMADNQSFKISIMFKFIQQVIHSTREHGGVPPAQSGDGPVGRGPTRTELETMGATRSRAAVPMCTLIRTLKIIVRHEKKLG